MNILTTLGRILFAIPFAVFGINHFIMYDFYMGQITSFIPFGGYMIMITGVLLILTSLAIIFKKFITLSTLILAGLLFLFIVSIHIPNLFDSETSQIALIELLKDTSLLGGALLISGACKEKKRISIIDK